MAHADTTRINQIHMEHAYLTFHDAALISIENQLHRIAEVIAPVTPAPGPEADIQLTPIEKRSIADLTDAFEALKRCET